MQLFWKTMLSPINQSFLARSAWVGALASCVFTVCAALNVQGQLPTAAIPSATPRHHSVNLEAQSVANGGATQIDNKYSGAPYQGGNVGSTESIKDKRVANSKQNIKFSVRNFGTTPDEVTVEWYFVAMPTGNSLASGEFVFDQGSQNLAIQAGHEEAQTVSSKEVQAVYERSTTITTVPSSGTNSADTYTSLTNSQHGVAPKGWLVRLLANGLVLAARGSSQHYEDIAKDDTRLKELLSHRAPPAPLVLPSRFGRVPNSPFGNGVAPTVPGAGR